MPGQVHPVPLTLGVVKPLGIGSVTVTVPLVAAVPEFVTVMVYVTPVWPWVKLPECDFRMVRSGARTVIDALAVPPVPPSVEVTWPVVLFFTPSVVPVTSIEKVHELLAAMLAPDRLTTPVACVAVIVPPPHEPVRLFGVATINPAGKVSLNPTPVSAVVLLFWMVKVSEVEAFTAMLAAPKALMITGGPTTVTDAVETLPLPASVELTWTLLVFAPAVVP